MVPVVLVPVVLVFQWVGGWLRGRLVGHTRGSERLSRLNPAALALAAAGLWVVSVGLGGLRVSWGRGGRSHAPQRALPYDHRTLRLAMDSGRCTEANCRRGAQEGKGGTGLT
jgi:hypothetical protein